MLAVLAGTRCSSAHWRPPFGPRSLQGYNGNHPGGQRLESVQAAHVTMPRSNDKHRIIKHYDIVSPYYRSLWGEHLHHGYWIRGDESKEKAQLQLIEHLAQLANVKPGSDILDIGCGFGGSSLYLAKHYNATVTGINISSVQVEMATRPRPGKTRCEVPPDGRRSDELRETIRPSLVRESISHYQTPRVLCFCRQTPEARRPFAITDWFKKENLTREEKQNLSIPSKKACSWNYTSWMTTNTSLF